MTAALVVSLVLNVALLIALFCIAVLFSRALSDLVSLVDRQHVRNIEQQNQLTDRLMAVDFATFREARTEDLSEDGGQIFPSTDSDEVGELLVTQLSEEELRRMANERTLLTEDFPEERE